ncbi:hypothetical protein HY546_00120 [archaeon]|nr:hypothetical protein [archaeon]
MAGKLPSIALATIGAVIVAAGLAVNRPIYAFPGIVVIISAIISYIAPAGIRKK